jgi:hypothetical protein
MMCLEKNNPVICSTHTPPPASCRMVTEQSIARYFDAEKAESLVFLAVGLLGLGVAVYAFFWRGTPFAKGLSYPLCLVGLLFVTVGATILLRSDADKARVTQQLQTNQAALTTEEVPRMEKVMRGFVTYRYTELGLLLVGLVLSLALRSMVFWQGVGVGLVIMSATALTADFFAERRGGIYLAELRASS